MRSARKTIKWLNSPFPNNLTFLGKLNIKKKKKKWGQFGNLPHEKVGAFKLKIPWFCKKIKRKLTPYCMCLGYMYIYI